MEIFIMKECHIKSSFAAAYLLTQGLPPSRIEIAPRGYKLFFYPDFTETHGLLDVFYADQTMQGYVHAVKEIRAQMREAEQREVRV